MISTALVLVLLSIIILSLWTKRNYKKPPGPKNIPIFGSLPFITLKHGVLDWILDKDVIRNKISTVSFGFWLNLFIINDYELAKDLFGRDEYSGRRVGAFLKENRFYGTEPQGVIHTEGSHWVSQRRFSLKTLKDFGFGKQSLESTVNEEIDEIIGYRFTKSKEHERGLKVVESVSEAFATGIKTSVFPLWFNKMFPVYTGYGRRVEIIKDQKKFWLSEIKRHQETLDESSPRDFIDVYLIAMKNEENESLTMGDLAVVMGDMFIAGTETSSTTLKWILLYLCLYPEIQNKCREEINKVLDKNSRFNMSQATSLPYTMATITEIQRVARVAPMSLLHATRTTTNIGEFTFPPGSLFVANLSHISHDPEMMKDPHVFNPERWIGTDGRFLKSERLIPFGIGKRTCMGELLARNEICLFTVNLIQQIKFSTPKCNPKPSVQNYNANLTRIPDDFFIRFESV